MCVEIARIEDDVAALKPHRDLLYLFARRVLNSEPNAATGARDKPERSMTPPMPVHTDAACSGDITRVRRSLASHL